MPKIYVFFGLIASGKSTLAQKFADHYGFPYYNTDRVRKELAGLDPATRCVAGVNQGIYTRDFSRQTYQAMLDQAKDDLQAGQPAVVLDGSYAERAEREQVQALAASLGAAAVFIICTCAEDEVKRRLSKRAHDPQAVSDGRWENYQAQKATFEQPDELRGRGMITIETDAPVAVLLARLYKEVSGAG